MSSNGGLKMPRSATPAREVAVELRGLGKCFNIYRQPHHRLLQGLVRSRRRYFHEFWALRDIDVQIWRGEIVGIVGRNGSGKSTLLQIVCGTLQATSGSLDVEGRVAALLELGAGFNPEFTGRENVYVNGAILGLSTADIDARFSEIVDFAGIGDFIDRPVKTYSSGMFVRLAFAVAACVDPDILIIDEALAVGDARFQAKCFRRFEELTARGTTIILVTHSLDIVTRFCNRALLLDGGRLVRDGTPRDVVNVYLNQMFGAPQVPVAASPDRSARRSVAWQENGFSQRPGYNPEEFRWGSREAEIVDFALTADGSTPIAALASGQRMRLVICARFHRQVELPIYGLTIKTPEGVVVFGGNTRDGMAEPMFRVAAAGSTVEVAFRVDQMLGSGDYLLSVGVSEQRGDEVVPLDRRYDAIHLQVENRKSGAFGLAVFDMDVEIHDHALCA
jgi:lipopolysaccharide transport system ATP-binding protein